MKRLWKRFERLTNKCYLDLAEGSQAMNNWDDGYASLCAIIEDGRSRDKDFARELYLLDDGTDYQYDVQGWLEDYLDELSMHDRYAELERVCRQLLEMFQWEEVPSCDIRFMLSVALRSQGKLEEALDFCRQWHAEEPDDTSAAAALIYTQTAMKDWEGAEETVRKYISEGDPCTEDTELIFTAASALYRENGDKKAGRRIDRAIRKYEDEMEEALLELDDEEELDFGVYSDDFLHRL